MEVEKREEGKIIFMFVRHNKKEKILLFFVILFLWLFWIGTLYYSYLNWKSLSLTWKIFLEITTCVILPPSLKEIYNIFKK